MKIRTIFAASVLCISAGTASADIKVTDPAFEQEQVVALRQVDTGATLDSSVVELQKIRAILEQQNVILRGILKEITGDKK